MSCRNTLPPKYRSDFDRLQNSSIFRVVEDIQPERYGFSVIAKCDILCTYRGMDKKWSAGQTFYNNFVIKCSCEKDVSAFRAAFLQSFINQANYFKIPI